MKKRKIRKRKHNQNKIFTIAIISFLTLFLTVGYAAFQTNININIKGNIKYKTISQLKKKVVTSGDGLYNDWTETGRYIYRGKNPDNYITFNNEQAGWRIVSIETDGTIKIVRNSNLNDKMPWDQQGERNNTTNTGTYCTSNYGCNAWAATSNLVGMPSTFTLYYPNGNPNTDTTTYSGTVTKDASLNTFLNGEYYNNPNNNMDYLNTDKKYIITHNFYVGNPGNFDDTELITTDSIQEKTYIWNGKIGLIQATDFLKSSTDTSCESLKNANNSPYPCGNNNYLISSDNDYWTISPFGDSHPRYVWHIRNGGLIDAYNNYISRGVRPAFYLNSSINLKGKGTQQQPYEIVS